MTDRPPTAFEPLQALTGPAQQAMEYWVDGWQRTILFWDVLRRRSDAVLRAAGQAGAACPELSTPNWCWTAAPSIEPANYLLVRIKPPARGAHRSEKAPVRGGRSARRPWSGHRRLQGRQRTGRGDARRASRLLRRLHSRADAGPDDRRHHARRGDLPGEGHRTAPGGRRQALRDRQLPGRLGGDDAGGDRGRNCSARSSSPARRCRTGPASKARTRCATPAACSAAAG